VLLGSWLAGLAVRSRDRAEAERDRARAEQVRAEQQRASAEGERASAEAERARAETERAEAQSGRTHAEEIAALRAEQARLARDVHDVVGHSLAVILAQAESAQYLAADDTARQRQVLTDIAASARQSLADVRDVLSRTQDGAQATAPLGTFDSLVDGVRAAGHEVRSTEVGQSRAMPPETEAVAFRVLQEMLTNALRHGRRGGQVDVERHWEGDLRLEVANECPDPAETQPVASAGPDPGAPDPPTGQGVDGMRRRLEAVGGRLDVRRRSRPGGAATYTATAWLPLPEPEHGPAPSDGGP
jgi:signal transduction histidine kinase